MSNNAAILHGIRFLQSAQEPDGGFVSFSSPTQQPFAPILTYRTTFAPAIMLGALAAIPNARPVTDKLATWLLAQKNQDWAFNYWAKNTPERTTLPYPDDLDDTFCALIGLVLYNPALLDAGALGKVIKILIAAEAAVGGPYRTWLVPPDSDKVWLDIDIAVNSNIAHFLRLVAEPLPSLTRLMEQAIGKQTFTSPYYPDAYPLLYYIARAYRGPDQQLLANYIVGQAKDGHWGTPMRTALALSALKALRHDHQQLAARRYLLTRQQPDGSWPAEPYCIDPARKGKTYYHGAAALTTALVLEALQVRSTTQQAPGKTKPTNKDRMHTRILNSAARQCFPLDTALKRHSLGMIDRMSRASHGQEITLLPLLFTQSLAVQPKTVPHHVYESLGLANLYGWMAYTIFDDFLDDEGDPALLSVATTSLRYCLDSFRQALPDDLAFQKLVGTTFNTIDGANAWEVAHCRFVVKNGVIRIGKLPVYGKLERLAERSLGHTLTPLGVLAYAGISPKSTKSKAIQTALTHYLIARQLNDDAHDWQPDVRAGRISYVVACILGELDITKSSRRMTTLIPVMQQQFWHHTINAVCDRIIEHSALARRAAEQSGLLAPRNLVTDLCDSIDQAVDRTLSEQTKAKDFLASYQEQ